MVSVSKYRSLRSNKNGVGTRNAEGRVDILHYLYCITCTCLSNNKLVETFMETMRLGV